MRAQLDLHRDLAGRRREPLADADGDPRRDVFPGAERRAAGRGPGRRTRVESGAGRAARARAEPEPVEAEAAAQPVQDTGPTAGEGAGRRGELNPFSGRDLTDPTV